MKNLARNRIDVLVVGAGTGGASAAAAAARAGVSVALIDRKRAPDIGRKVCGDALTGDGVAAISRHIDPPAGAEIANRLESGRLILGHTGACVDVVGSGVVLNRLLFGQRLLADAIATGAEVVPECACVGWSDRLGGSVRLRDSDGEEADVTARVVIDASGYGGVLTRGGGPLCGDGPARHEVGIGYREVLPLTSPLEDARRGEVVLAPVQARSGYAWIFPVSDRLVNIGIGGPLASVGPGAREAYRAFVGGRREIVHSDALSSGAGMLPLRRPLASLVGDGFMTVGDAGCQTNPLHGGGIAPSVIGGTLAGERAAAAVRDDDVSAAGLWEYNIRFAGEVGVHHAIHEIIRNLLYSLSSSDFEFLARELAEFNFRSATNGAGLSARQTALLVGRTAGRPILAARFARAATLMAATRRLYARHPATPEGFERWFLRFRRLKSAASRIAGR